jgi:deazaflavin-dependent oxidoreductase (nitroreductase family)
MSEMDDMNRAVIEEFRANQGRVGGYFENMDLLLLTTTGAKSGQKRVNPLAYLEEDGTIYIFASKGGAPTNPDWYHNVKANPKVSVDLGTESFEGTATELPPDERDRVYAVQAGRLDNFAEYEKMTDRKIPVVAITRD